MLQTLGDKLKAQRWLGTLVLVPLGFIFALWGAFGIFNGNIGTPDYGLKINGEPVSVETLNRAWQERQGQYAQMLKGAELSDAQKSAMQQQLIDEYVRQTVLRQRVHAAGYRASDTEVHQAATAEPAFQVDGKYDPRVARAMLAQVGMSEDSYIADKRQSLEIGQLSEGVELSAFLTPADLARIYALENEQREVRYALLPQERFVAGVKIDDAKVKAWYDSHQADYMSPETVKLQYGELSLAAVAEQVTVTPQDLQAYYDKNKSKFSEEEKRHAHHILISIAEPKDAKADAAALAQAQQLRAQIQSGKDFSELAKRFSADPGSAAQGGDLGWAERGAYVEPFANALFAMHPGEVSEPVKTQYGYHLIKLDDILPAHVKTLQDAHAQIESDYRREQAANSFGDRQEQLQQKLESGANVDFDALVKQLDLKTGEVASFTRTGGGAPLAGTPDLLAAVFNDDVVAGHKIGGPVALKDDQLVVVKVLEHHPSTPQPLASVRDEIIAAIRKSESAVAAKTAADEAVKRLGAGAALDEVAKGLGVSAPPAAYLGRNDPQVPAQVRQTAFNVPPPSGKTEYRAVALDNGGAAVVAVSGVKAGTGGANPPNDQALIEGYMKRDREGDMNAYVLELQRRAAVKRNPTIFQ